MGTQIATTKLLSQSLAPHELDKHRAWIGVRIEVMLHGYWKDTPSGLVKDGIMRQWMNALHNFTQDEIDNACSEYVLSNPRRKPNEGHIRELIVQEKLKNAQHNKLNIEPEEPPREIASAEFRQAEMDRIGFQGSVTLRKFTDKPEERE